MLHRAMFSVIALVNFNVSSLHPVRKGRLKLIVFRITFQKRSPRLNTILSQFITISLWGRSQQMIDATSRHCIILLLINYLYKILINKSNKISYITMSMPLLYNIEKFNDTVIILYTVYNTLGICSIGWLSISSIAWERLM